MATLLHAQCFEKVHLLPRILECEKNVCKSTAKHHPPLCISSTNSSYNILTFYPSEGLSCHNKIIKVQCKVLLFLNDILNEILEE